MCQLVTCKETMHSVDHTLRVDGSRLPGGPPQSSQGCDSSCVRGLHRMATGVPAVMPTRSVLSSAAVLRLKAPLCSRSPQRPLDRPAPSSRIEQRAW